MSKTPQKRAVHKPAARPATPPEKRARVAAKVPLLFSLLRRHGAAILGLTLLVVFVHDVFGPRGYLAMRRNQMEIRRLRDDIAKINEENQRTAEQVKALKSDPKLIERIAREQMGMMRPGERVYRISPQEENNASAVR